jgi:hypothetical protein
MIGGNDTQTPLNRSETSTSIDTRLTQSCSVHVPASPANCQFDRGRADMTRDVVGILAIVGAASGCVVVFALICALAVSPQ